MPHEVNMADNGSHWKNKENKTQKVKIPCRLVTVLRMKYRPPGVMFPTEVN